jgi:hypothetical protein
MTEPIGNPIGAMTEKTVEDLVRRFGEAKVRKHLGMLIEQTTWATWQRVNSLITRVANRIKRQAILRATAKISD